MRGLQIREDIRTMRGETFERLVGGYHFTFEKLLLKNEEILFFVTSNMPGERSFFVSKIKGEWQILYNHLLGKELLKMESAIVEAIVQKVSDNIHQTK